MIKPASSACNLACDYCFYLDTASHREEGSWAVMGSDVAEAIITKSLDEADCVHFVFQGGEPTLAGLPFFERFVSRALEYKEEEQRIRWAFQTNGVLLDTLWTAFFKKHGFLVGISFDGSVRLHDLHRRNHQGEGSGRSVARAIKLAQEEHVEFNVLSVVTDQLADNTTYAWQWLVDRRVDHQQYIACIDPIEGDKSFLSPASYTRFLKESFDLWYEAFVRYEEISVRFFDNLVDMLLGFKPESCDMAGICSANYVVESNGNIYPCDFYCFDDQLLGNILVGSYADFDTKRTELRFIEDSVNTIDECGNCPWFALCRGGCKRYRSEGGYRFCSTMKEFFPFAIERLEHVAHVLSGGVL